MNGDNCGIPIKGLAINEDEFMVLPQKKQMCILFQNEVAILKAVVGYKLHQRVQYIIIAGLLAFLAIILPIVFAHISHP